MKPLFKMTDYEVQVIANNPNVFGSMLARNEMNKRAIKDQREAGNEKLEIPYIFDANDRDQYRTELYSVEWDN